MNKKQIAKELKILAQLMKNLGTSIEFYSKGELKEKGKELYGAGCLAEQWADEIGKE